jgi:hypothetical protein
MKTSRFGLFVLLVVVGRLSPAHAAPDLTTRPDTRSVTIVSELPDLARAYEEAFSSISRTPVAVIIMRDGRRLEISDTKSLRAIGSVVIIEARNGFRYIVNPRDIIAVSDDLKWLP